MEKLIFGLIIGIIIFDFILERILEYLNAKEWTSELPDELKGIYDEEKYRKSQEYKRANERFALITSSLSFIIIMAMLFLDGFAYVDRIARSYSSNSIVIALIFFGILMFASDIINTPFTAYVTFVIEEKFGFNKTTVKTFILDKIKGWILAIILGGSLLTLIIWIYEKTGEMFWIYTWIAISGFTIFMTMFYTSIILPLFNKLTPLEDNELKTSIEDYSNEVEFKLDNIYVMDGSKRSTKGNAFFSGLGPRKKIVLFDTLINDLKIKEIVAVLAHEIGHYKKKHSQTGIIISLLQTGITLFIFSLLVDNPDLSKALGAEIPSFHLGLITFGILYSPISSIVGLIMNGFSRKNEYAADRFAAKTYQGESLISALKKLSVKSLSNLTPHPAYVFFHYSHPPLLQRIRAIRKVKGK